MGALCCTFLLCFLIGGPKPVSSKPVLKLPLSSALTCKRTDHYPIAARFAPMQDRAAVVVGHHRSPESIAAHVLTVDANILDRRVVGDVEAIGTRRALLLTPEQDLIQWSPDAAFVAILGQKSVSIFNIEGGGGCSIPVETTSRTVGFARGPSFVIAARRAGDKRFIFFDTSCREMNSAPRQFSFDSSAVSISGESFAFLSLPAVWMTSQIEQGASEMELGREVEPASTSRTLLMGRFTEEGRTLCVAGEKYAKCYDTESKAPVGTMPAENPTRMLDASARSSRLLFPYISGTVLDGMVALGAVAASIAAATQGNGGGPLPDLPPQPMGCLVWDYRSGKEVYRWEFGAWEQSGFGDALKYFDQQSPAHKTGAPFVCAITSAGERLLVVTKSLVQVYALPKDKVEEAERPPT